MSPRVINAVCWLYLWLCQGCTPVTSIPDGSSFGAEKLKQFVHFGPFDEPERLLGRGIVFLIPWLIIHLLLRKAKNPEATLPYRKPDYLK